jgi:sugar/nucleoside kinase (ribokinase family)
MFMNKYHVYGIGNALLDLDFEVSVATLERLSIDKGVMTLIDEDKHHYLLEELDGIKHLKACGGSVANTLFTLQQMGAKTFYSCKVGNDEAGDFFYQNLVSQGIHTNLDSCQRDGVTGKCIVLVTPDADRTMNTFLGATSTFSKNQLSETALSSSEFLYIEGYLSASPLGCEAAIIARQMARKHQIKTAISLSDPNMVTYFRKQLCDIIEDQVDILFCNEEEAKLFTETDDLETAKERLMSYAQSFVITLGSRGALVYNGSEFSHVLSYKTTVVDTVGAGDVFAGVFLYAITHGHGYFHAADLANYAASKVVAKFGPRLSQEEINEVALMVGEQQLEN